MRGNEVRVLAKIDGDGDPVKITDVRHGRCCLAVALVLPYCEAFRADLRRCRGLVVHHSANVLTLDGIVRLIGAEEGSSKTGENRTGCAGRQFLQTQVQAARRPRDRALGGAAVL